MWSADAPQFEHYNGAVQAVEQADHTTVVVWTADFKPDELANVVDEMMSVGAAAMKIALDRDTAPNLG